MVACPVTRPPLGPALPALYPETGIGRWRGQGLVLAERGIGAGHGLGSGLGRELGSLGRGLGGGLEQGEGEARRHRVCRHSGQSLAHCLLRAP